MSGQRRQRPWLSELKNTLKDHAGLARARPRRWPTHDGPLNRLADRFAACQAAHLLGPDSFEPVLQGSRRLCQNEMPDGRCWADARNSASDSAFVFNMQVVEIFLPVSFPNGDPVPAGQLELVRSELTDEFGGVTIYFRSPAMGAWRAQDEIERDLMVIFEVMIDKIDHDWWTGFRTRMEETFHQQEILIRAHKATRL